MNRRIILAVIVLILCPIAFGLLSSVFPKRYTSSMGLLVDQTVRSFDAGSPLGAIDDLLNFARARSVQTQLEIITGSKVLSKAIENITPKFPQEFPDAEARASKIEKLIARLRVDVSKESDVITLRVTSENPELSAEMANAIGNAFIEESQAWAAESGNAALTALDKQIESTKTTLATVDGKVSQLKTQLGVADPTTAAAGDSSTLSALQLRKSNVMGELEGVRSELQEQERILNGIDKDMIVATGVQLNPQATEVEAQLARAKSQLAASRARYLDDHPIVQENLKMVQSWEEQMKLVEKSRQIQVREDRGPNPNYTQQISVVNTLKGREKNLANQSSEVARDISEIQDRLKKYAELERSLASLARDRTVYEQTYLQLVQRRSVVESTGTGRKSNATIVSPAYALTRPSFPDVRLFTLMGIGLGVVLAALIVMPKAPTETYVPVIGADRVALGTQPTKKLAGDSGAAALGDGDSKQT